MGFVLSFEVVLDKVEVDSKRGLVLLQLVRTSYHTEPVIKFVLDTKVLTSDKIQSLVDRRKHPFNMILEEK